MYMTGKQKLYFLLDAIEDARIIAPSGQRLLIDPTNDLNRNYRESELVQLFTKLEVDEKVLKVLKPSKRVNSVLDDFDPYDFVDDGCWHIELLPSFNNYFFKIQSEPEYYEFTGRGLTKQQDIKNSEEPVFVVHGHDDAMNSQVMRFIEKLGLDAIDLAEKAGGTLSMQEKLQKYSNVKFAVVLFTADDIGRLKTSQTESARNRQNVIYELAGFQKQLGREHVAIIQKERTELPSDIAGIHYIPWHDTKEGWKILLARELKDAGLNFDFNRVL
jgi:hypothetical protein